VSRLLAFLRSDVTRTVVLSWLVARVAVVGALALATFISDDLGASSPAGRSQVDLLGWDASWYRDIATEGYDGVAREAVRFFPLLPALGWLVGVAFGGHGGLGVLVVANGAAAAAAFLLHRLVVEESGDESLATRSVWLLALAPPAFVLVMGYAESLFLTASVASFLYLRRQQFLAAGAAGCMAALCRPIGLALMVPAIVEAARGMRSVPPGEWWPRLAAVLGPAAGMAAYLAWVGVKFGDAFRPLALQEQAVRRGEFVDPVTRLIDAGRDLAGGDLVGSGLHLPWAVALVALVAICFRRWPAAYGLYAAIVVAVALSASNLDSLQRYGLSAFPLLMALATLTRSARAERVALSLSAAGLVAYALLAFLGAYVP
jgi:hypothetical protein